MSSLFQAIARPILLIKEVLQRFIKSIFVIREAQKIIFFLLEITAKTLFSVGYFCGWLGVRLGIIKTSSLKLNIESNIVWWNEDDDLAIFDFSQNPPMRYSLNETGKRIWELLVTHKKNQEEIVDIIVQEYDAEKEVIRDDVEHLSSSLQKIGA